VTGGENEAALPPSLFRLVDHTTRHVAAAQLDPCSILRRVPSLAEAMPSCACRIPHVTCACACAPPEGRLRPRGLDCIYM